MAYRPTRREMIAGAAGASAVALSGSTFMEPAAAIARGVVFEDRSGDGRRRASDPGIAGVMVSNGRDVTLTGADGSFSLPVEPGESIFLIKPPHWTTPTSLGGIPCFSHLHQPQGSPPYLRTSFPLVEPTGPLPASLDFPLMRREESRDFEALLVSDTQPENLTELGYVRDAIVSAMLGVGAAFGINHGDVVADDLSLYPRYLQLLDPTGIPWHHCPGNHDLNYAARDRRHSHETWKRTFGPRHYAFQYGEATFFVLDNVEYLGGGRYRGAFGPRQLAFVRNVLAHVPAERLVVLSMHIPLACYLDPGNPADTTADCRELARLLSARPHSVSFAGHLHATEHHYLGGGESGAGPHHHHVLTAASGSWWSGPSDHRGIPFADSCDGTPNGFHLLSASGNRYATRFVPAATKPPGQLRVMLDGPHRRAREPARHGSHKPGLSVPRDALGRTHVVANVFDGGPTTTVLLQVAGHPQPIEMQRVAAPDPLMVELFSGEAPRKAWVAAVVSSHIWQAPLPAGLGPGAHVLKVRARDEYGREHIARAVIEVTPA